MSGLLCGRYGLGFLRDRERKEGYECEGKESDRDGGAGGAALWRTIRPYDIPAPTTDAYPSAKRIPTLLHEIASNPASTELEQGRRYRRACFTTCAWRACASSSARLFLSSSWDS